MKKNNELAFGENEKQWNYLKQKTSQILRGFLIMLLLKFLSFSLLSSLQFLQQ
jgi:hypothetical protein